MSRITVEIEHLCTDLRSDKPANRNKAIERVLQLLNSADDIVAQSSTDTFKLLLTSLIDSLNKVTASEIIYSCVFDIAFSAH